MFGEFDVASRMAEGRPAVVNLQLFVRACHQLGYQQPDLTLHPAQLQDEYGTEEGMDLIALQHDCGSFEDAARATQDALAVQERQLAALPAVWQGSGSEASRDFLRRHGEAAAAAAASVCTAVEALRTLREVLWRAVDGKVDAVVEIEGRAQAQRADWLAAAATVTTGLGDQATASELVDQAVKPFVDSGIRGDWLASMQAALNSVSDAYQRATAEIAGERQPVFDLPGDLGPTWSPALTPTEAEVVVDKRLSAMPVPAAETTAAETPAAETPAAETPAAETPAMTLPSAWSPPLFAASAPPMPPVAADVLGPAPAPLGSGTTEFGSGLAGLGRHFADMLGGLLGGADNSVPEVPGPLEPDIADIADIDEEVGDLEDGDEAESDPEEAESEQAEGQEVGDAEEADDIAIGEEALEKVDDRPAEVASDTSASDTGPVPAPAPPPAEPLPPLDPPSEVPGAVERTPCAIAADALPQVGDPPE